MSFDKLTVKDYTPKSDKVIIEVGDDKLEFTAKELSFMQSIRVDAARRSGEDHLTLLMVLSIVDSDGRHMTMEQALALNRDYALPLIEAAIRVNQREEAEKN